MQKIAVLDCGGQYTHLIARKVRDLGVYSEILPAAIPAESLASFRGVILSGGPSSVYDKDSPQVDRRLFDLGIPILGICYGHQLIAYVLKGKVEPSDHREYGMAMLDVSDHSTLLRSMEAHEPVWMSHGDLVLEAPPGFQVMASTSTCQVAAMSDPARGFYGVQFHVEVTHTRRGKDVLSSFLFEVCHCAGDWTAGDRVPQLEEHIRGVVGSRRVFFFVSGGVDSTVAFTLCVRALQPGQVHGVYIDTGFMRKNESQEIATAFGALGYDVKIIDARTRFREALAGVIDPEEKRRRIGEMFITVQDQAISQMGWDDNWMLGQGTIYPDTIESGGTASAAKIKTHHNRVGRVEEMIRAGRVVEPISELYKDEVRQVGRRLELPAVLIDRHPFPGPGLAIRCICSGHADAAQPLSTTDRAAAPGYQGVLIPVRSVGVQGDFRTYAHPTLLWDGERSHPCLAGASTAITNASRDTNRVTYLLDCRIPAIERRWRVLPALLTEDRIETLQEADARVRRWIREEGLESVIWQFPVVLIPLAAKVGETIVLRPVESVDGMTAEYAHLDFDALGRLTPRLLSLPTIEAVILDISNKPPATIEWE